MEVEKIRRDSVRRHRLSSADATYYKPTMKGSINDETCSDEGEIEFEGWVEFITKNDKDDNDDNDDDTLCEEKINKSNGKRKSSLYISSTPGIYTSTSKMKKGEKSGKIEENTKANKNISFKNEGKSDYTYTPTNYLHKEPVMALNNGMVYANGNNVTTHPLIMNTQEKTDNTMNILQPNYVDPPTPVVLKNQQVLPQLYIRQPPTVIVTNESRPPLVINPPPANIVFKNKAPQPIYVNSARPNIIIKNDPPVIQNPVDMDSTPIHLDVPMENTSTTMTESIKYPYFVNLKNESIIDNKSCFFKGNINNTSTGLIQPSNIIQLDNSLGTISHQMIPNVYMMNENGQCQGGGGYQTQTPIYAINPMGNTIQTQAPVPISTINSYESNIFQYTHPSYAQAISAQPEQCTIGGGILLNQPVQMVPQQAPQQVPQQVPHQVPHLVPHQVHTTTTPQQVHLTGTPHNYQAYSSTHPNVTYGKMSAQQVGQHACGTAAPQYFQQNYVSTNPIIQEQMLPNVTQRRSTYIPNNNISQGVPTVMKYNNNYFPQHVNTNKIPLKHQPASASSEFLPTCGPVGCASTNQKSVHTTNMRRNSYVNPQTHSTMQQPLPKKVQIMARPMYDQNFRGYN
ncbi:hypothetical protein, conserved [Plasmodium gonderi]|uniref:Pv-fam-g protein n=1 Tax=Plasmodium gonderi TaxID=77519 RepID=A0A1Y1JQ17_PLAGO|nr:hypothetical protein, conserved [Plasmodium gonderi]GAW82533.1 hypothetical protein, conserved [Plasmodium gonderi]